MRKLRRMWGRKYGKKTPGIRIPSSEVSPWENHTSGPMIPGSVSDRGVDVLSQDKNRIKGREKEVAPFNLRCTSIGPVLLLTKRTADQM